MKVSSLEEIGAFTGEEIEISKSSANTTDQRTEKWFADRLPCYTGSVNKNLMSCGRSSSKLSWGDPAKLFDFGTAAVKMIYRVGNQRKTGLADMSISSQRMNHGSENEGAFIDQLLKDGIITDYEERAFERFYEFGGASVDGMANIGPMAHKYVSGFIVGEKVNIEAKCTTSWDGHYMRMYYPVDEKHNDFWQHQSEMMATGVKKLLYAVARPMVTNQYDLGLVKYSELHANCLLERCKIGDLAISLWDQHHYDDALSIAIAQFSPEKEEIKEIVEPQVAEIKAIEKKIEKSEDLPW